MNGFVDDQLRALLPVSVAASREGNRTEILAWIDTAFNGGLTIPQDLAAGLGLVEASYAEAILADGKSVELPLFRCIIDWFGHSYETEIAASDGKFALLGTVLLGEAGLTCAQQACDMSFQRSTSSFGAASCLHLSAPCFFTRCWCCVRSVNKTTLLQHTAWESILSSMRIVEPETARAMSKNAACVTTSPANRAS